ncbi:hypothetical protein [Bifidobacterium felsineum]|uniref:hypothetical protein n=1 Tax=Bifidobacterium felsineum TaxID=2045440 RepID=UPI001BDD5752|nr:hypothetical protein [Bifidobacterium felsineum]MBT1164837.1 hypothetical protein [Bifidobacterium felsineum]
MQPLNEQQTARRLGITISQLRYATGIGDLHPTATDPPTYDAKEVDEYDAAIIRQHEAVTEAIRIMEEQAYGIDE